MAARSGDVKLWTAVVNAVEAAGQDILKRVCVCVYPPSIVAPVSTLLSLGQTGAKVLFCPTFPPAVLACSYFREKGEAIPSLADYLSFFTVQHLCEKKI